MGGMQPNPAQQGQPQQQPPPQSPQLLLALLTHLMMNGGQNPPGQPLPQNANQISPGSLEHLLPNLLQIMQPPAQPGLPGQQSPTGQQSQPQGQQMRQAPQQQSQDGSLQGIMSLLQKIGVTLK